MNISLNWLRDYVEIDLTAEQVAETLSDLGLPYEGIEYVGDDAVIDIEVTSNRGDCLSYIGIARELAAATGKQLKMPDVGLEESDRDVAEYASVEILEPDLCGRYTARVIEGIKVVPSPAWLRNRLETVGLRSVNNVVDATNYAMMETGQPPHAFDYAKIEKGKIIVRKAVAGERITSIDGTKCELNTDMLVITDPKGPVAIAGVMGGLDTEVSENTKTILLEDAYFHPVTVRTTSRRLGLPSEAAFRFERIVDIEMVDWASKRTSQLIKMVAGGKVAKGVVDVYPKKPAPKEVTLRLSRLNKLLGIEVPRQEVIRILSALNFIPQLKSDSVICIVPSWRHSDSYREVDLIEEVARIYGYNKIPTERKIKIEVSPIDTRQKLMRAIGAYLNGCGFYETINVSFVDNSVARLFAHVDAKEHLAVTDISRKGANLLRQTLLGSLLGVLKTNLNVKNSPCRIFEIADTFVSPGEKNTLPVEDGKLALVCDSDLVVLQGVIEGLAKTVDRDAETIFEPTNLIWSQAGARIVVNGKAIGAAGVVSKTVRERFDFGELSPAVAELDLQPLLSLYKGTVKVKPIPRFPAIQRDLSIVVDQMVRWADIIRAIKEKASVKLESIQFVGIYRGKGIPPAKKSVTLSLRFRDEDGTLTHDAVDRFQADIVRSLADSVGAELRTL
jgi:phenylalanyl-tRNA synthetase beta chain